MSLPHAVPHAARDSAAAARFPTNAIAVTFAAADIAHPRGFPVRRRDNAA
ncbi:hypothetical protein [Nannocystis punicea]|uniref:Uncharacterized protein n=1 Tax=Nannocystis punicea TaxID=2995304 RepID=A0ABY7H293_9BACT|nr:hypothetical protein [Nannocystis poenicansa]WAS93366.1 hypothetical protein O0S08_45050 [Nannocystis poenicansa]